MVKESCGMKWWNGVEGGDGEGRGVEECGTVVWAKEMVCVMWCVRGCAR